MGTSVAAATALTALSTLLGLMARKSHGKMAVLVSYLWLCITTSIAFFIRLLARRVFRPRRAEESYRYGSSISAAATPLVPSSLGLPAGKPEEEGGGVGPGEERQEHVFQFKFCFQIPEQSIDSRRLPGGSAGEDGETPMVTSISNYRFFPEGDHKGFVEAPQAMTLRVRESYMDSDGIVRSNPEELDRELKGRLSSVKHIREADANIRVARELDRELKNRLLSVKFSRPYDSDGRAAVQEEEWENMSLCPDNLSRTDVSEELELLEGRLPGAADAPVRRFLAPAEDFGGFDSDTTSSESRSDGYSVKHLIVESDSDGFFSERNFEAEVNRARLLDMDGEGEVCVEFEQESKSTQLPSSPDSVRASEDFDGERIELPESEKNSCIEMKREGLPNSIISLDLHDDVVSNGIIGSNALELDGELKIRFSIVRRSQQADSDIGVARELDRELKSRLLSVKSSRQCDLDAGVAVHEEQEHKSLCHHILSRAEVSEELELRDLRLPDEVSVPAGGRLVPVLAGDLGGFNSDSESESGSDGYSVKDLVLDFDSDGLFPEKDSEAEVDKACSLDMDGKEDNYVELEQKSKATHLPNSLYYMGSSEDFDGDDTELLENVNKCVEINGEDLPNSICSSGIHGGVVAEENVCAAELESDRLHREVIDPKEAINGSSNTDEVSSITSHVGLDAEHWVKVQPEMILSKSKGGQGGTGNFGVEESESSESREPEGTELSKSCGLGKEYMDLSIKNQNMKNPNLSKQVLSEEAPVTASSESNHVDDEETGDVAVAGENSDELKQGLEGPQDSEETHLSENSGELSKEELEELESFWENEDLIDLLRMDLKKARATGLPTILEESESPKVADGLEPWKPEARFPCEDPIGELHKFYKSYRERMKKLDVLNRQKMYAIGFLQLKDPLQSKGTQKPIIPALASVLSQNLWRRKSGAASEKFVKELRSDIETVYVGQLCLSWEFLRWQYETTRELLGSDPHDGRQYNQVAEEFQQFQVLIQRFLENEPFQGPRVPNYAKNRCMLRRLLQVPVVREDCFKDKKDERRKWKDGITGEQLEYIMEDSISIFWDFVKSDKDETPLIMKGLFGTHVELQDPTDSDFMADIQTNLKQKQKKLKDILRTGNCLVKKFKKPQQGRSNQDDLFFSQVDLKLASRVLKMTRITTDQLAWCHKKLSKIAFVDRKLLREPSFLLFPC